MKMRLSLALASFVGGWALAQATPLLSQQRPETIRVAVMTFHASGATDRLLGAKAADVLRGKLQDKFSKNDVTVLVTKDNAAGLQQSGFDPNEPLPPNEERALANFIRADDYVSGQITQLAPTSYRLNVRLVSSRDNSISQLIPAVQGERLDKMMEQASESIKAAMKQIKGTESCIAKARTNDVPGAIAVARAAIAAYPSATMARLCIANIQYSLYSASKTAADSLRLADSTLAIAREILQYDSLSVPALKFATELYKLRGDTASANQATGKLVQADPTNTKLASQVIAEYIITNQPKAALPLVKDLLERNPADLQSMRLAFQVYVAADAFDDAAAMGPQLARVDTAFADSSYFLKMAYVYGGLKQPEKAAEVLAQGAAKYPANTEILLRYAGYLRQAGQVQKEGDVLRTLTATGSSAGAVQLAAWYGRQNMADSMYALIERTASAPSIEATAKSQLAAVALSQANTAFKGDSANGKAQDADAALKFAKLSQRLERTDGANFLVGASAVQVAIRQLNDANKSKSCNDAQGAKTNLAMAAASFGLVTGSLKDSASPFTAAIAQYTPFANAQVKQFCK